MGKKKDKRTLIAGIDECDMQNTEIEYRFENLDDHEYLMDKIFDALDSDMPGYDNLLKLYEENKYAELAAELKKNNDIVKDIKKKIEHDVWEDHDYFQMCFDDEIALFNEEFANSKFCGWYRDEHGDDKYYKDGQSLLYSVMKFSRSNDFKAFRCEDGTIIIDVCQYCKFTPVENFYKPWIGKCVAEVGQRDEFNIFKITGFSEYYEDGAYLEVREYDREGEKFSKNTTTIHDGNLLAVLAGDEAKTKLFTLDEARYRQRIHNRTMGLQALGVISTTP